MKEPNNKKPMRAGSSLLSTLTRVSSPDHVVADKPKTTSGAPSPGLATTAVAVNSDLVAEIGNLRAQLNDKNAQLDALMNQVESANNALKLAEDDGTEQKIAELKAELDVAIRKSREMASAQGRLIKLPVERFYSEAQARTEFDEAYIAELSETLKRDGQFQPIVVHPENESGKHLIAMGECRWRAASLLPGFELEAVVSEDIAKYSKQKQLVVQVLENVKRRDLSVYDMARICKQLSEEFKLSQAQIATEFQFFGKNGKPDQPRISRYMALYELPEIARDLFRQNILTDYHLIALLAKIRERDVNLFDTYIQEIIDENGTTRARAREILDSLTLEQTGGEVYAPKLEALSVDLRAPTQTEAEAEKRNAPFSDRIFDDEPTPTPATLHAIDTKRAVNDSVSATAPSSNMREKSKPVLILGSQNQARPDYPVVRIKVGSKIGVLDFGRKSAMPGEMWWQPEKGEGMWIKIQGAELHSIDVG